MFLNSIASAFPRYAYTQQDTWDILSRHPKVDALKSRSREILSKVLTGDSGIDQRYFSLPDLASLFDRDAGDLNQLFEAEAPLLGKRALASALERAGMGPGDVDALIVCTCTGYLCPGVSSYIAEQMEMRPNVYLQDIVGLGCGAAIPTLRSASGFLAENPDASVAMVAVEVCSAAFYIDNDPGVLISLCLFGDGASASIWKGRPPRDSLQPVYRIGNFDTLHIPGQREKVRFVNYKGTMKNKLHRTVPELSSKAVEDLYETRRSGVAEPYILTHSGGREVLKAIRSRLNCGDLPESTEVLREAGNLSSPSVLVALEKHLEKAEPESDLWLTSFGAGFACHSADMTRVG